MTLEIVKSRSIAFPRGEYGVNTSSSVLFYVDSNIAAPGHLVCELATQQRKLPALDEFLGEFVDIEVGGVKYTDPDVFAARYSVQNKYQQGRSTRYEITVDFEAINTGFTAVQKNFADPYFDKDPLTRPLDRTLEYQVTQVEIESARNLEKVGDREIGVDAIITNTANFPVRSKFYKPKRTPVFVLKKWVSDVIPAISLNAKYEDTYNDAPWYGLEKHQAKFLSADFGESAWWKGAQRYQLVVKVAMANAPWYLKVPNVGDRIAVPNPFGANAPDQDFVQLVTDINGFTAGEAPLKRDGLTVNPFTNGADPPINLAYTALQDADYTALEKTVKDYA